MGVVLIFAVDFDGTMVEHEYPNIGDDVPLAFESLLGIQEEGHQIILFTMRAGKQLEDAVEYLTLNGIQLWGINENPDQSWSNSPKPYAHMYIDDSALGCPLVYPDTGRPYVDWVELLGLLEKRISDFAALYDRRKAKGAENVPG